jgi:hypothetical protein
MPGCPRRSSGRSSSDLQDGAARLTSGGCDGADLAPVIRTRGALAGLAPSLAVVMLFAWSGTEASPSEAAVSLGLVTVITCSAGWLAAPLLVDSRSRLAVATIGYAIAVLCTNAALAIIQAAADSLGTNGLEPVALIVAVVGRAALAVASAAYLIVPALIAGSLWSLSGRGLALVGRTSVVSS